jgi:lipopolysaccharide export system protein LptA
MIIQFKNTIDNASVQIGDQVYYINASSLSSFNGQAAGSNPIPIGGIKHMTSNTITVSGNVEIPTGSYVMFAKDNKVNSGSLKGYYASVKMRHFGSEAAELFAVSSEVTESSK